MLFTSNLGYFIPKALCNYERRKEAQNKVDGKPCHIFLRIDYKISRLLLQVRNLVLLTPTSALMPHNVENRCYYVNIEANSFEEEPLSKGLSMILCNFKLNSILLGVILYICLNSLRPADPVFQQSPLCHKHSSNVKKDSKSLSCSRSHRPLVQSENFIKTLFFVCCLLDSFGFLSVFQNIRDL